MSFPVDDIVLGPRSWGRLHRLDGIIWHTGEESGFTRDFALATADWQKTNPGSYNFRVYDGGVMLNVPYLEASGGVNPSSTAWAPERFPSLARDLGKAGPCPVDGCGGPYRNPTMHHLQVSFVGKTADLEAGRAPASYVPDARRLIDWAGTLPNRGPTPLVHSKHAHWQTNRSDPGDRIFTALFPLPDTALEDEMTWVNNVTWYKSPALVTFRPGTAYRLSPTLDDTGAYFSDAPMSRVVIGEVAGFDFGAGPRWFVIAGDGGVPKAVHSQDEVERVPLNAADAGTVAQLEGALDAANQRTASVKKTAAEFLRKGAAANRDTAAGLEAAAKNVETL